MLPENAISLGARLSAIRDLAGSCASFADIGADHGRLSAHMLLHGLCERAQLADISEASLVKARRLIYGLGLSERATFCVGDGAQALKERPDVAVVAGMGGQTIAGIVERGRAVLSASRLVLQPNVAAPELRMRLQAAGFCIVEEVIAREGRRLYVIIAAQAGQMRLSPEEMEVGPVLLRKRPPLLFDYAAFRLRVAGKALAGARRGQGDAAALEREISIWEATVHGDGSGHS
ncbi:MAG TPA: SAM-dependent methyltransferase [Candidatus Pullichristensenella avicola]|nr:SAM-dependent methyltransferase [Candidatus Pullichristensenella avicola]